MILLHSDLLEIVNHLSSSVPQRLPERDSGPVPTNQLA